MLFTPRSKGYLTLRDLKLIQVVIADYGLENGQWLSWTGANRRASVRGRLRYHAGAGSGAGDRDNG